MLHILDDMYVVEVGSWDGKHLSNSYNLLQDSRWKGVLIEGDEEKSK